MTDMQTLHQALLRPAILHILRAAGFHSSRSSVIDTLTDLCSRYLLILAQRTADSTYNRTAITDADLKTSRLPQHVLEGPPSLAGHGHPPVFKPEDSHDAQIPPVQLTGMAPNVEPLLPPPIASDVLQALSTISFLDSTLTPSEEAWREKLRKPLSFYPAGAAREKERRRRDAEDTRDIQHFIDWCTGGVATDIRRVAGVGVKMVESSGAVKDVALGVEINIAGGVDAPAVTGGLMAVGELAMKKFYPDDYLALMKKKYSRTSDGARYAGTVLGGKHGRDGADDRGIVRIEGGPESLREWKNALMKRRRAEANDISNDDT